MISANDDRTFEIKIYGIYSKMKKINSTPYICLEVFKILMSFIFNAASE